MFFLHWIMLDFLQKTLFILDIIYDDIIIIIIIVIIIIIIIIII